MVQLSELSEGSRVHVAGHWPPKGIGLVEKIFTDPRQPEPLATVRMDNGAVYVKTPLRDLKLANLK